MPENDKTQTPANQGTMLNILEEKDKIIVSLKESSTQRDKINESQIRALSEDNERKQNRITDLSEAMQGLEKTLSQREAELAVHRERSLHHTERLADLRKAVDEYKSSIDQALVEIRTMVTHELQERDERGGQILGQLKDYQQRLESKLVDVEGYYKDFITQIAGKQVKAKLFIRKALVGLQEALNQLDLNPTQPMLSTRLANEFNELAGQANDLFQDYGKTTRDAGTIIHNIENVHLKLSATPKLDRVFREMGLESAPSEAKEEETIEVELASEEELEEEKEEIADEEPREAVIEPGQDELADFADEFQDAIGPEPQVGRPQAPPRIDPGAGPSQGPQASSSIAPRSGPQHPTGAYPPTAGTAALNLAPLPTSEQAFKLDEDLILRDSPNLAPYNWNELPISSPLLHYRRMLNSAKQAETEENYIKAIEIYKTIMQQKTIQDNDLARNILKDQLEALDRLARSQLSLNKKRHAIERYFGRESRDDQ